VAYWGKSLRQRPKPQAVTIGEGVNTYSTPFEIKKSEAVSSLNTSSRVFPALSVRPGTTVMFGTGTSAIAIPNGAGVRAGSTAHVIDGTTWKYWNGSSFTNVATGLANVTGKILEFNTETDRYTLLFNGTDKKSWNGTGAAADLTDAPATKLITVDDYRLYALAGSNIKCSASSSVSDWTTVDDADTLPITGMEGAGTAIAAFNDMVIGWSDKTMHILYGNDVEDWQLMDPIRCGCVSDRSVIEKNGVLYFLDYNEYKMFTGGIPVNMSQRVKTYLEAINYTYKEKIVAGNWGKYIYLSIPYGANATTNTITLEYDTELKRWYPWNKGYLNFFNIGNDLYGITSAGVAEKLQQGTSDGGTAISWSHVTGVWNGAPIRPKKVLSNLWMIVDLPVNSTLNIAYSTSVDNNDFVSLYNFTASANEQNVRVQVPTTALQAIDYFRLKFSGTGPCTIHFAEEDLRIKGR
jgi:hypothetical protein